MSVDDQKLIEQSLAGSLDAFGQLVVRHQDRLYNALVNVVGSADDARDIAQDAFVKAFQKLETFRGRSAFYSWLFRIAMNTALTQMRKKKRHIASLDAAREKAGIEPLDSHPTASPSHPLEVAERQTMVRTALAQLSDDFRTVLVLKEMDGLKYDEIAEILECPVGTVRSRIHRARTELRQRLAVLLKDSTEFTKPAKKQSTK